MGREPVTVVVRHKSCMSLDGRGAPPNVSSGALSLSPGGATPRGTFDSPLSARGSSADITPSSSRLGRILGDHVLAAHAKQQPRGTEPQYHERKREIGRAHV